MAEADDGMTPRGATKANTIGESAPARTAGHANPVGVVGLLLVMAMVALGFLHTYRQPLDRDITTYAVIGRELLNGRRLYTDIWDNKPPAIHVVFAAAEFVAGPGPGAVYLLNVLAATASLSGIFLGVCAAGMGARAGWWAAALLGLLTFNIKFQGNMPNTEVWINACLIWMLVLLFRCRSAPMTWRVAIGLGFLAAAATLFKHVAAFPVVLVGLADLVFTRGSWRSRVARLGRWAVAAAVVVLVWSAVGAHFWLHGRFHDFYEAVIVYNASFIEGQRVTWQAAFAPEFMPLLLSAVVPAEVIFCATFTTKMAWLPVHGIVRVLGLHLAMALGCYAAALAPGKFYPHYFQLLFPTIALSLAWVMGCVAGMRAGRLPWLDHAVAAVLLLPLALSVRQAMRLSPQEWSLQGYGTDFVETWAEAPRIQAMLRPGETFWDIGSETGLYYLTGQPPPVSVFYQPPLFRGPLAPQFARRTLEQLQQRPPDMIVLLARRSADVSAQGSTPLVRWVSVQYREVPGPPATVFRHYVRRGSALDSRLAPLTVSSQP